MTIEHVLTLYIIQFQKTAVIHPVMRVKRPRLNARPSKMETTWRKMVRRAESEPNSHRNRSTNLKKSSTSTNIWMREREWKQPWSSICQKHRWDAFIKLYLLHLVLYSHLANAFSKYIKLWTIEHVFKYACALLFRSEPGSRTAGWSWSARCRRCARTICCLRWFCHTCTRFSTTATTDSDFRFLLKALWCIRSRRNSTWCHIFLIITSWCRGNITTEDAFKDSLLWNT